MIVIRFRELDPGPADFLVRGSPWDQFVEELDRARPTAVLFSTARRRQPPEQTTFSTLRMMDSGLHRLVDALVGADTGVFRHASGLLQARGLMFTDSNPLSKYQ